MPISQSIQLCEIALCGKTQDIRYILHQTINNVNKKSVILLFENFDMCNFGILLSLYTDLRIGEVCALKWEDVLFDERVLYIHQTMQRLQITNSSTSKTEITVSSPKSECSMRKIPIPDKLYDFMVQYRQSDMAFFFDRLERQIY